VSASRLMTLDDSTLNDAVFGDILGKNCKCNNLLH